ncbi:espG family protein [Rhodococcus sp. MTM3W5.2]|uniref:ESX secretion-associated protein EspG n=1 Tax=Rhodococcus sp. MTM3W5.2 TaxID=1805827 RepID=UPI0009797085|nr:ESX secretion-associated protein EspG [Rhodococcus sp. MTM3W5.2]AQA22199.1 espG family protein [Rhodococcus sp. MTM3W5.2]
MSDGRWRLTALEFTVLWERFGRDRLPYPFQFRGTAATDEEFRADRQAAAQKVVPMLDEGLYEALVALAEPVVRIELCGFRGAGLESMIRMHAGIRQSIAAVAVQLPGADLHAGADVLLASAPVTQVGTFVAQSIPSVAAGRRRGVSVPRSATPVSGSLMQSASRARGNEERDEFFLRPRTGLGEITVFAGPAYDNRPTGDGQGFHWMDFADDGRYLVRGSDIVSALPARGEDIAAEVQRLVGVARAGAVSR